MEPKILRKTLEDDDGYWNIKGWNGHDLIPFAHLCEWKVLGGGGVQCPNHALVWCQECGLLVCRKHKDRHSNTRQHTQRMEKLNA